MCVAFKEFNILYCVSVFLSYILKETPSYISGLHHIWQKSVMILENILFCSIRLAAPALPGCTTHTYNISIPTLAMSIEVETVNLSEPKYNLALGTRNGWGRAPPPPRPAAEGVEVSVIDGLSF
jgi:hypothetical protein